MKYRVVTTLLLGSALALGGGQAQAAAKWEELLQKFYDNAKKEGEVIINVERTEEIGGKDGIAAFQKRYPGIKVNTNGQAGSTLAATLINEARAGKLSIDAFRADPNRADELAARNLLLKLDPAELTDKPVKTYFDNGFIKLSDQLSNFVYNTEKVKAADRPMKFEDLLDPKWNRKLALDARGGQIAHLLSNNLWEEKKFWDFVKGLKAQNPIWTVRNTEAIAKVVSGEGSVGTGSHAASQELKEQGGPVEFLFLGPVLSQVRGMGIMNGAPHPNAGKLFLGWLLSPEGSQFRDKNFVGMIEPGSSLYAEVQKANVEILYEDKLEQILARDAVAKKITAEWGALK
jgi:iron(III) transport system substrate-binding protein